MGKHRAVAAPVGAGHRPPGDGGELMAPFAVSPGGIYLVTWLGSGWQRDTPAAVSTPIYGMC
jgi:hypothetical protein